MIVYVPVAERVCDARLKALEYVKVEVNTVPLGSRRLTVTGATVPLVK